MEADVGHRGQLGAERPRMMMNKNKIAVVAVGLVLAGCGTEDTAAPTPPLFRAACSGVLGAKVSSPGRG